MKRRDFIKNAALAGTAPFVLNGIPFKLMAGNMDLQKMAAACPNDRVLVILQLHGGNDGLNAVIPVADYDKYQNVRANIAIPENGSRGFIKLDSTLATNKQVGLHPDMIGMKALYDQGKLAIVQGISYENHNQSHFRGRDIMFMGGGAYDYLDSGWVGRYLKDKFAPQIYPQDFPNADMQDPLALEFGNELSLIFHQGQNIPTSISIYNPQQFFDLVEELPGFDDVQGLDPRGLPPTGLENSPYGKELDWILGLEEKTDDYDDRLLQVYQAGKAMDPHIAYPQTYPLSAPARFRSNPLSAQLQIIANMIHGGCKTKVYLIRLGGFDTHADQVVANEPTMGVHAALLYHISSAMKAFQDDLQARSIEDRVMSVTISEFGRRIHSNGSYGTDHGIGAPLFVFGKGVIPGLLGVTPNLDDENVAMQYDYRQVYATIMKEWMCVDPVLVDSLSGIFNGDYLGRGSTLPLVNGNLTGVNEFINSRFRLNNCYPNPATSYTSFQFYINSEADVELKITDLQGRDLKIVLKQTMSAGEHQVSTDLRDLKPGYYIYTIKAGVLSDSKQFEIAR
ncbi:MAG TPA: DUF1501 domain-containing protein [Cytophagaceae bacterium]|nr:DUF1501 domain-containing protein [Cytophagaceae bacterium]